ncbi:MAG: Holliday junction branch migration DNA helicase RuvB, partial [Gemmatimonadota bacterium]|nr:Holliday junction branch migration DNA helicase RuvB [Gemmatimonadota bacterium]
LAVGLEADGADEIAKRSRGTPRVANRLLRRVRDYAQVKADGTITKAVADAALARLNVDEYGLDDMDARILTLIIEKFGGGPVGLNTIAVAVGEDAGTIEEVYEPFLIQQGFLHRTPRGRQATPTAYRHFGFTIPPGTQGHMFD